MINLIIKGAASEAEQAAAQHGIFVKVSTVDAWGHSRAVCADQDLPEVVEWFCEHPHTAPYPPGTLLFYRHHTEKDL